MTPRVDVTFLSMPVTPEAVAEAIRDSGHRAFPVALNDELDDVDGVLFVSDLFRSSKGARSLPTSLPDTTEISRKVRRPPLFFPSRWACSRPSPRCARGVARSPIVLDEYGGVAGRRHAPRPPRAARRRALRRVRRGRGAGVREDRREPLAHRRPGRHRRRGRAPRRRAPRGRLRDARRLPPRAARPDPRAGRLASTVDGWELRVQSMERRRITEIVARKVAPTPA